MSLANVFTVCIFYFCLHLKLFAFTFDVLISITLPINHTAIDFLAVVWWFECLNDLENYTNKSRSSWQDHPRWWGCCDCWAPSVLQNIVPISTWLCISCLDRAHQFPYLTTEELGKAFVSQQISKADEKELDLPY